MRDQSDGDLLGRFADAGDQGAFAEIVRRHGPMVLRICRRYCGGDLHAAEDVAQQVFLTLASRAAALRTRPAIGGWLYRAAWNVITRLRRDGVVRACHERNAGAANQAREGEPVPFALITAEMSDALSRALATLPENYRDALVMHHFGGCTVEETARRLNVKTGTAASWLSRGRAKLRDRLEGLAPAVALTSDDVGRWLDGHEDRDPGLGWAIERRVMESVVPLASVASNAGSTSVATAVGAGACKAWRAAAAAIVLGWGVPALGAGGAIAGVAVAAHQLNKAGQAPGKSAKSPAGPYSSPSSSSSFSSIGSGSGVVPEPSTGVVMLAAAGGLLTRRARRRRSSP